MTTPNNTVAGLAEKWRNNVELKVGDRVVVIDAEGCEEWFSTGSTGTISVKAGDGYWIDFDPPFGKLRSDGSRTWFAYANRLASPAPSVSPAVEGDAGELPELPSASGTFANPQNYPIGPVYAYSADQMRAYGEQCRRLATPAVAGDDFMHELAEQPEGKGADRMAIRLLVAAGHVTEAKANEALCIAHGFEPGPLAPAAPVGVDEATQKAIDNAHENYMRGNIDATARDYLIDKAKRAALAGKDGA